METLYRAAFLLALLFVYVIRAQQQQQQQNFFQKDFLGNQLHDNCIMVVGIK